MSVRPLRHILSFQSILVAAIPFVVVMALCMVWLSPLIEAEIEARQRELAGVIGTQIESYLSSAVIPARVDAALAKSENSDLSKLQPLLDAQLAASGSIGTLYLVNEAGHVVAAGLGRGGDVRRQELLLLDISRGDIFKEVLKKRQPVWSDSFLSAIGGGLSVAYAVPSGKRIVIAEIQLTRLAEFLKKISTKDTLMIMVVDRRGQVIADQDGRYTAQQLNVGNIPLIREEMKTDAPLTGRFTFEGRDMVGSMLHVPEVDWHILVAQPVRVAYHVALAIAGIAVAGLIVAVGLAAAAAIFMARRLARRFEALAGQARRVATGERGGNWPKSNISEIKELAEDLQQMSETLNEREESLEQRVSERTSQLEVAASNLSLARDAADAANKAKSMFLANMSHEIRTPMNAVLGFAQLLERDPSLSAAAHNKVSTIMKSGDHLLAIINDILEMSKIEAGRVNVREEPIDLNSLLDDLAVMFRMRAEEKGLVFTLDIAADLLRHVVADVGKLRQILINLMGNAVKFTKSGSITMRAFMAGVDRIAIEVEDSGIGITPEEQTMLFRPFERAKSGEQAAGGTGLGLAISLEYAHLIKGNITVTSSAGAGSCFRFEFPAPATALLPTSSGIPRQVSTLTPGQGEIRVLVVDDVGTNRELLRAMLEPLGFVVEEASDGKEAVRKALAAPPRIVLMDRVMPGMDGVKATRILRESFDRDSLTIIGITASAFGEEKQLFLEAGLNAYIRKPFREQELFDLLAEQSGVLFEMEENVVILENLPGQAPPSLANMSNTWCEAFWEALARKNITRIRRLGEEAQTVDPALSAWIMERAGLYDVEGLKRLIHDSDSE